MNFSTEAIKKNVLIISYVFPDYPGIAGRRWAKFAKYLTRNGFTVHVICSKNPFQEKSLWIKDIQNNPNIILYKLPTLYPKVLQTNPQHFLDKVNYFLWATILPLITKGTIYDRAIFWKSQLLSIAKKILYEYNIENIIVSGAPFNLNYFTTMVKNEFPFLNVISDLRDPWTWGHGYGYPSLSPRKKFFEKNKEQDVIKKADYITVPAEVMKEYLVKNYPQYESKIFLLPHAFDQDEVFKQKKSLSKKLRLVFYGSIYDCLDDYIKSFCEVLKSNSDNLLLDFYSDSNRYQKLFEFYGLSHVVTFYPSLEGEMLFAKFKDYDYVLLMYPDYAINYLSTKFFEVIETRTPFLYIGNYGYTAEFIVKNKIGIHLPPLAIKEGLRKLMDNKNMPDYNFNFDISSFSFANVSQELIKLFR